MFAVMGMFVGLLILNLLYEVFWANKGATYKGTYTRDKKRKFTRFYDSERK